MKWIFRLWIRVECDEWSDDAGGKNACGFWSHTHAHTCTRTHARTHSVAFNVLQVGGIRSEFQERHLDSCTCSTRTHTSTYMGKHPNTHAHKHLRTSYRQTPAYRVKSASCFCVGVSCNLSASHCPLFVKFPNLSWFLQSQIVCHWPVADFKAKSTRLTTHAGTQPWTCVHVTCVHVANARLACEKRIDPRNSSGTCARHKVCSNFLVPNVATLHNRNKIGM